MSSSAQLANAVQGARAMAAQGDVRGAFALLARALDGAGGALGGDDPDVLAATCVLAKLHTDLGELSDARRVLEQALAVGYHRLGDGHAVMLALSYELARIADELGNVYEAKRRYGQLARLGPAALGEDHPSVRAARRYLGLPEPEGPFHVPHQSAPAPFEPLSAPIGTTTPAQPTWPVDQGTGTAPDDRPIFHPEPRQETQPAPAPWRPGEPDGWDDGPREGAGWQQVDQGVLQRPDQPSWPSPDPADPTSGGPYPTSGGGYPVSGSPFPTSGGGAVQERAPWTTPPPEQDVGRRRSPLTALLVILIVAVLGGITAAVVSFIAARPDPPAAIRDGQPPASAATSKNEPTGPSGPSGAAAANPKAPGALKLRDDKTSITLTWTDPSKGSAPFIVAGGQQGALRQLQVLAAGATTYTLNGLNPTLDYCFTVAAVYGTDSVALSGLACTQRK
ncbi:tetratricopeptide repeat protein [Dactylosporangium siamense]|uniref:Fibronectin type-III domain-containing protein n=1 Tax=Dactylosporangium siamense TaxID=685454 RepID=A0A919PXY5_9ACTN|nr:tetratricopeptide repeat protein [Dactylosporangium siamense]GIG52815.1 hypothetical protein Dsi01nite_108560 [Dactylosporangium siamense]